MPRRPIILDDFDDLDLPASRKAQRLSSFTLDDTTDMRNHSRRADAALLKDITNRLSGASFSQPLEYSRSKYVPTSFIGWGTSSRPLIFLDEISTSTPSPHSFDRGRRATSLPPDMGYRRTKVRRDVREAEDFPIYRPPRLVRADLQYLDYPLDYRYQKPITRVPPRASYYSDDLDYDYPYIRKPSPFLPRSPLDFRPKYEGYWDPGVVSSRPMVPSADLAVRHARRTLSKFERGLGFDYDDLDIPSARTTPRPVAPPRPIPGRRPVYLGSTASPSSRYAEIEARVGAMVPPSPPVGYASLRSRTADARNKMDQHRVLLDRYLPVYMGPLSNVQTDIDFKYDELAQRYPRMPNLEPLRHDLPPRASSVPPYRPAPRPKTDTITDNSPKWKPSSRPPISDVRRRARQVLCKTKGNPGYYN